MRLQAHPNAAGVTRAEDTALAVRTACPSMSERKKVLPAATNPPIRLPRFARVRAPSPVPLLEYAAAYRDQSLESRPVAFLETVGVHHS